MPADRIIRARIAAAVLLGVFVFLLGSLYHEVKQRDRRIAELVAVNRTVVDKLADVLTRTIAAEKAALEAGQTPTVRIEDVLERFKGVDQALIDQALQQAYNRIARAAVGPPGPPGPPGPAGPVAPTPTSGPPGTTTTTGPAGTSTTTRPAPAGTTSSTTTTTRCSVSLLGACLFH